MSDAHQALLRENLDGLRKSVRWLRRSFTACSKIGIKAEYTDDQFDDFENLAGRYARTIDAIVNKVFRSIDAVELEDGGTLLDVVHRAEKRSLVESAEQVKGLKDLRNDIVHEYETDDLRGLFQQVLESVPAIFKIAERTDTYCDRFFGGSLVH